MDSAGSSGTATYMFQNTANFGRFKVFKDKTWVWNLNGITYNGTNMSVAGGGRLFKWNIRFRKPLEVRFNNNTSGNVGDIVDNSFHLIGHTDQAGLNVDVTYKVRTVFTEP